MVRKLPFLLLFVALGLSACAQQPPVEAYDPPGFWIGLVHGVIVPFSLIGSIFSEIRIYAFPNTGGWYDFGFVVGLTPWGFFDR